MKNGIEMEDDKFDMFADMVEESDDVVEVVSVVLKSESKKKLGSTVKVRSQEEYDEFVESFHYETFYHPETNEPYQVKVTVLKPEVNPLENMRPVFAYSTNH